MPIDWSPLWLSLRVAGVCTSISLVLGLWLAMRVGGHRAILAAAALVLARPPDPKDPAGFSLDVDFPLVPGVTAVFGPPGAGKSLVMDSIAGFAAAAAGRIMLDDVILFDADARVNVPPRSASQISSRWQSPRSVPAAAAAACRRNTSR